MKTPADVGAALRRFREARGMSLEQVARRIGLGKTGVQAVESGRSGASLDRYAEIAAVVGAELTVDVRQAGGRDAEDALYSACARLSPERLALVLRVAESAPDVDDALMRGFVEGLETWARTARASKNSG